MTEAEGPEATTVLVVDDDPLVLRSVSRVLKARGLSVVTSDTPFGVSALVKKHAPAAMVLDVDLPGMSGERLANMLSATPEAKGTPIVFYSALDEQQLYALTRDIKNSTFVSKSRGIEALVAALLRAVKLGNPRASGAFRLDLDK